MIGGFLIEIQKFPSFLTVESRVLSRDMRDLKQYKIPDFESKCAESFYELKKKQTKKKKFPKSHRSSYLKLYLL